MAYYCSEAVHDEKGRLGWEGLSIAGDNNGSEVITRKIAATGERWEIVYRPKDSMIAYILGESALQCATNDNIGYDQSQRLTLYEAWKALPASQKNIMNINKPVECDCSAMVAVCCMNAGLKVDPNMRTVIEDSVLLQTGEFVKIQYTQGMKLYKGDILWRNGHTGIVSGVDEKKERIAIGCVKKLSGVYDRPKKAIRYHVAAHPFVGKGNMVDILGESGKFYLCDVAGVEGYILKERIVKG